jgi:error-prone DNA polymerase
MAMIVAGFTGGEAEELRRAMGFKRSQARMAEIERRLRQGMADRGIVGETQERIVQSITSFALYGFPESHAASFALIAYASAYLKCHYLAAFTAAILNNQPMGFYHPATIIKDAQRHGLRVLPVDLAVSDARCTVENRCLRLGLNYVRGLRSQTAAAIVEERRRAPFASIVDVARRVPQIHKDELRQLAAIGALNPIEERTHRRSALWKSEFALRPAGPLLEGLEPLEEECPLEAMEPEERMVMDFAGAGLTIGKHPLSFRREALTQLNVVPAAHLKNIPDGKLVRIAGSVICRQRPETAKGFAFFSLEDETGIANAIVTPPIFDANRHVLTGEPYLLMEGIAQNQQGAVSVRVRRVKELRFGSELVGSHDFC